jgi:hypothetical protein
MIEAVNSAISNGSVLRVSAEQISSARSFAADAAAVQAVARAPLAPYISPYISIDANFDKAVLQLRDSATGDVINQFPSEQTLQARQRQEVQTLNSNLAGSAAPERAQESSVPVSIGSNAPVGVTIVQEASVEQPQVAKGGAGQAQAAIAALSVGAQAGQVTSTTTVSVTA